MKSAHGGGLQYRVWLWLERFLPPLIMVGEIPAPFVVAGEVVFTHSLWPGRFLRPLVVVGEVFCTPWCKAVRNRPR